MKKIFKQSFVFEVNRYEEWKDGLCISKGAISAIITAENRIDHIHFTIDNIGCLRITTSSDFEYRGSDILSDRIQYVHATTDRNPISPDVCHIFCSNGTIDCVRFAMSYPDRLIEFYGRMVSLGKSAQSGFVNANHLEHSSNLLERATNIERHLMSELMIESTFQGIDYTTDTKPSEIESVAMMQEQYELFCLQAKSSLVADRGDEIANTSIITMVKNDIKDYINKNKYKNNEAMLVLSHSSDIDVVIQQISMLVFYWFYKNVKNTHAIPPEIQKLSISPNNVSSSIGLGIYFTLLVNDGFCAGDFNELFVESWYDYYNNWMSRQLMLKMRGDDWLNDFDGALFSDKSRLW